MKYFIATDLHGSAYWAEKVAQKFQQSGADRLILLGDVYNHGPRNPFPQDYAPMRVAEILNGIADKVLAIKGNCDSEVDEMISDFMFVRDNVVFLGDRRLFFTHGHIFNKNNLPKLSVGDVMFYGHFHLCEITNQQGIVCVNVGSCALPKDGNHCYCTVDEKELELCNFDGNIISSVTLS